MLVVLFVMAVHPKCIHLSFEHIFILYPRNARGTWCFVCKRVCRHLPLLWLTSELCFAALLSVRYRSPANGPIEALDLRSLSYTPVAGVKPWPSVNDPAVYTAAGTRKVPMQGDCLENQIERAALCVKNCLHSCRHC